MKCVPTYYFSSPALAQILPVNISERFTSENFFVLDVCHMKECSVTSCQKFTKRSCQFYVKKCHRLKGVCHQIIRYFTAAVLRVQTCWVMSFITLISLTSRISPSVLLPWALHVALFSRFFDMPVYPTVVASAEMLSLAVTLIWLFFPLFFCCPSWTGARSAYTYIYLQLSLHGTWGHANISIAEPIRAVKQFFGIIVWSDV